MKIGGKMYLADQQRASRSRGYRQQMNRAAVQNNLASMQSLTQSVFSTNVAAGQEGVSLVMQAAVNKINSDVQARYQQLMNRYESLSSSVQSNSTTDILT